MKSSTVVITDGIPGNPQKRIIKLLRLQRRRKMRKEQEETKVISVRLDSDLVKKIDQEAKKELRTRNNQICFILNQFFQKNQ